MKRNGLNETNGKTPDAEVGLSTMPLPASRKVYVEGTQPNVRVPFREITLSPAPTGHGNGHTNGGGERPTMCVYDTSGPYTDPQVTIDIHHGLTPLRQTWIVAREDSEELPNI